MALSNNAQSSARGRDFGPDHGTGHLGRLRSTPRLAVVGGEALAGDQRMPKSPHTATAVSDGKTAPLRSCRLHASEKRGAWPSDLPAVAGALTREVDDASVTGTRCALRPWHGHAGTPPLALGPVVAARFALPRSPWPTLHRARTARCEDLRPASDMARRHSPCACGRRVPERTRAGAGQAWRRTPAVSSRVERPVGAHPPRRTRSWPAFWAPPARLAPSGPHRSGSALRAAPRCAPAQSALG
jgi:hypothetical protein